MSMNVTAGVVVKDNIESLGQELFTYEFGCRR